MLRSYKNEEQQTNNSTNINSDPQINTDYSTSFSFNNSFFSSRVYKFKDLPQSRNATKGKILNIIMYNNLSYVINAFYFILLQKSKKVININIILQQQSNFILLHNLFL